MKKIIVTGTRGIPYILGGVETHCENLYPYLVQMGYDITIVRRSCYINNHNNKIKSYKGIKIKDIYAPKIKSLEAIIHTFLAILYARYIHADIVHIHAIGPAIMVPLAKILGLKVIMTHHGSDYDRKKWGNVAKYILKIGEKWGIKYANEVIVISDTINKLIQEKYNRYNAHLIFNGVNTPQKIQTTEYIESLGLIPNQYIIAVGRFVEEKGFDLLIQSYLLLQQNNYKLVIVGDADHESEYSKKIKKLAFDNNIILTGFIKGKKLNEILSHARLFVLPSYHEGLPIALLEAMSYNLDILVSNIPANKLSQLNLSDFFECGSINDLFEKLRIKLSQTNLNRIYDLSPYQWKYIANQTEFVYKSIF